MILCGYSRPWQQASFRKRNWRSGCDRQASLNSFYSSPALTEAVKEAALAVEGRAINI